MSVAEQRLALEYFAVLQDILKMRAITLVDEPVRYALVDTTVFTRNTDVVIGVEPRRQLLFKLAETGAFKLKEIEKWQPFPADILKDNPELRFPNDTYYVDIQQPRFNELYDRYKGIVDDVWGKEKPKGVEQAELVTVQLVKDDNRLYLLSDTKQLVKRFHTSSSVDDLLSFVINSRADMTVSIDDLKRNNVLAEVTSFSEVVRKAGLKPLVNIFIVDLQPSKIRINTIAKMTRLELDQLVQHLSPKIAKSR